MLVLSTTTLTPELQSKLTEAYQDLTFQFTENIEQAQPYLSEASIIITYGEDLTDKHIERATQLKWVMVISAGMDQMPFEAIKKRGIQVTNARGIHRIPMAEYAIAMLLQLYRKHEVFLDKQKARVWDQSVATEEISYRTMTIIGAGAIGEELARIAKAFHIKTIGVSNRGREKPYFDQIYQTKDTLIAIEEADFVVSILPSTSETKGFYQAEHFETMKSSAIFLNMGRGDAVEAETIIEALDQEQISHAVLDVFEQEPLPEDHPLWRHEKVTLTPHISGKSSNYLPRAMAIFEENLVSFLNEGQFTVNVIDPNRGY